MADEIRNMPAGTEMDALVAEKVMGWTKRPGIYANGYESWGVTQSDKFVGVDYWHPSTDIAAAWEVVEKLESANNGVLIRNPSWWGEGLMYWQVQIATDEGTFIAREDTAPLAICRAALLAGLGVSEC